MSDTSDPLISVVIPHLNEPEGLRGCLRALTAQRLDGVPFEVIVVDNGSSRPPFDICAAFEGVTLVEEPVPGPGPARNRGAAMARGKIIAFVDADCVAAPGWVTGIARFFSAHPDVDVIGGKIRAGFADPARPTALEAYERAYSYRNHLYVRKHGFAATGNMAVRTPVFRAVGPFGGITTMEDTAWGRRATALGHRVAYAPDVEVTTPACLDFDELVRRWNRHISHDYAEQPAGIASRAKWLARACAIAVSPAVEAVRLAASNELTGWRSKALAFSVLVRLRFYRSRRMISLLLDDDAAATLGRWNREDAPTSTRRIGGAAGGRS